MISRWLVCVVLGLVLGSHGCGGGQSGPDWLEVVETAPEDGDSTVQLDVLLAVRFDEALNPDTLTVQTFALFEADGSPVPGSVRLGSSSDLAIFEPDEPLAVFTDYRATVTTELLGVAARGLEEDYTWRFRTVDDEWGVPVQISENLLGDAASPQIGVDAASNAVAVWLESDGVRDNVVASRFTRQSLWSEPEPIESGDGGASELHLSVNFDGEAIAVWREQSEGHDTIWANRFTGEDGWGEPETIEAEPMEAGDIATTPKVVVDPAGNATAVWYQTDLLSSGFNAWSNRYTAAENRWGVAEIIEASPPSFRQPSIALDCDDAGNVTAIWARRRQDQDDVWANHYAIGEGWGTAVPIEDNDTGDPQGLALAVTGEGEAHALWSQPDESDVSRIWTNVYSAGEWGSAALLNEEEVNDASSPQVGAGPAGTLQAVWSQSDGRLTNIWANRYTPEGQWGTPELIELPLDPRDDGDARNPQISVDQEGNSFAVWQQFDGAGFNIWSNRYTPEEGWFEAELLETDRGTAVLPQVAVAPDRRAHAIWQQEADDPTVIRTIRFE
jgi:hypothetical protein